MGLLELILIVVILVVPLGLILLLVRWLKRGADAKRVAQLEQRVENLEAQRRE